MGFKKILLLFIILVPLNVYAAQGCCSWHGGISHCGNNGYYICNDGTQSPSCTCSSYYSNSIELTDTSCICDYSNYNNKIDSLNNEINKLKNENKELKNKNEDLKRYLTYGGICISIYILYKIFNKKHYNK